MNKQTITVAVLAALLVTPAGLSKTVTIYVDWDQARAIFKHGEFRQSVKVTLLSSKPLKGKFAGITDSSVRIRKSQSEIAVSRNDVRAIRLVPRRSSSWTGRLLAIGVAIPAGLLALYGGLVVCGDIDRDSTCNNTVPYLAGVSAPYLLYRLAAKADRGALILLLPPASPAKASNDPDAASLSPEERP